jgi:hypothetical protein
MKMLSRGAMKDFMVLQFVHSMIEVSMQDTSKQNIDLLNRDNKSHKLNKKIDKKLEELRDNLKATINMLFKEGGRETAEYVKKNLQSRIGGTLTQIQRSTINLEMLAMYVLYVNFAEKQRPLHPLMQWLNDADMIFGITDMMTETAISILESDLFLESYSVVSKIKE